MLQKMFQKPTKWRVMKDLILKDTEDTVVNSLGIKVFRGAEENVLKRMMSAIAEYPDFTTIIRVTGDDILIEPDYLKKTLDHHFEMSADYTDAKNLPSGTEVEVFESSVLKFLIRYSKDSSGTEYLTNYITDNSHLFDCSSLPVSENETIFEAWLFDWLFSSWYFRFMSATNFKSVVWSIVPSSSLAILLNASSETLGLCRTILARSAFEVEPLPYLPLLPIVEDLEYNSTYALKYLKYVSDFSKLNTSLDIHFIVDNPALFIYDLNVKDWKDDDEIQEDDEGEDESKTVKKCAK